MEIHPPHAPAHSFKDFAIQLVTITAGVLIALSFESVREWNHDRTLRQTKRVRCCSARSPTTRREVEGGSSRGVPERQKNLDDALRLADELLAKKKPTVHSGRISAVEWPSLSSASWQTAERTGALALHGLRRSAEILAPLQLFRSFSPSDSVVAVDQLGLTIGILHADPTEASTRDLELFRERLIELRATLTDRRADCANRLVKAYEQTAKE